MPTTIELPRTPSLALQVTEALRQRLNADHEHHAPPDPIKIEIMSLALDDQVQQVKVHFGDNSRGWLICQLSIMPRLGNGLTLCNYQIMTGNDKLVTWYGTAEVDGGGLVRIVSLDKTSAAA